MGINTNEFDKLREKPSQLPVPVTKDSYQRMILHCITQNVGHMNIWGCRKTGARVRAYCIYRTVYDRTTKAQMDYTPVMHLYCSSCDTKPKILKGESIWNDELQTVSM